MRSGIVLGEGTEAVKNIPPLRPSSVADGYIAPPRS